jgi:hypothetical protein
VRACPFSSAAFGENCNQTSIQDGIGDLKYKLDGIITLSLPRLARPIDRTPYVTLRLLPPGALQLVEDRSGPAVARKWRTSSLIRQRYSPLRVTVPTAWS